MVDIDRVTMENMYMLLVKMVLDHHSMLVEVDSTPVPEIGKVEAVVVIEILDQ